MRAGARCSSFSYPSRRLGPRTFVQGRVTGPRRTRGRKCLIGIPATGHNPERLAQVLNGLRDHYATEHGPSPSQRADRELAAQAAQVDTGRRVIVTWFVALRLRERLCARGAAL